MNGVLMEILEEARRGNALLERILEQIEDERVASAKRNCPDNVKEIMQKFQEMMSKSPMGAMVGPMITAMMAGREGGKDG
jgi:hypothetical protein